MLTQTRSRCYYMDGSLLQNFKKRIVWSLHFSNERLPDKYDNLPKQTVIYNQFITASYFVTIANAIGL